MIENSWKKSFFFSLQNYGYIKPQACYTLIIVTFTKYQNRITIPSPFIFIKYKQFDIIMKNNLIRPNN